MAIKFHYYNGRTNFGDALAPYIVEKLLGEKIEYASADVADLCGAGSIFYCGEWLFRRAEQIRSLKGRLRYLYDRMHISKNPMKIWGSGFLKSDFARKQKYMLRPIEVCAVRGKYTHAILSEMGLVDSNRKVAYGDPGLLYPMLLDKSVEKQYDIGVVPHEFDRLVGEFLVNVYTKAGLRAKFIDVMNPNPLETLATIASCETILSSSMHGCIVSDGMGIPNAQLHASYFAIGKEEFFFKFRDYYSAFDMELPDPMKIDDAVSAGELIVETIKKAYKVNGAKVEIIKECLVDALPFKR